MAVNTVILGIVVLGMVGMISFKSSFFPLNEARIIEINVVYPGASPLEMEEGVVLKIEDNIRGLVGIDRFTSQSGENSANIKIEVLKGYDMDVVLADVKNAVDKVPSFPAGMEPPVISKQIFITNAVTMALSGKNVSLKSLKAIGREIETDLRNIEGISQVEVTGFPDEEIEIAVSENMLRAYQLTFREVADAIAGNNILVTGGTVKTPQEEYLIRVSNRAYYSKDLDHTIIRSNAKGNTIRLKDVATVRDIWSEVPDRTYFNGHPAITIDVNTTISEDLITTAELTNNYVNEFNEHHDNVQLQITRDASIHVVQRTWLLIKNGGQGVFMVLILLALFLKPRLAFWVAFGLPISFFGMFIFADSLGVTINVLSLFGMIIVVGILVDDGIVVSENIYHHFEKGKGKIQAAIDGTMEVLAPITSAIITTLVAFSTFFFLEGRIGEFFSEVSIVVILTLSISLVEALIILPAHVAHSKALDRDRKPYRINVIADQFMSWMRDRLYAPSLKFFLHHKFFGFAIPITLFIITIGAIGGGIIRSTFFPSVASERVTITLNMPQGTAEAITDSIALRIEEAVKKVSNVYTQKNSTPVDVVQNIEKRIGPGTSNATISANLSPHEDRDFSSDELANAMREETGTLHGAENVVFSSGGNFGGKPISISLLGSNIQELKAATSLLKEELKKNGLLKDVIDNDPEGIKEIKIELKENAYAMGFTLNQVISQVRSGFFGYQVQRFQRSRDEIKVWVRYDREERSSIKNLDDMRIVSPQGHRVPLKEIANYTIERGDISINHLNGKREIRLEADLKDPKKSDAAEIMTDLKNAFLPKLTAQFPTVSPSFEGQNREANKVLSSARRTIPIVLFLIFIIIAFTFRSFSQPLLLMLMVPFSLIGVGWGHWLHGLPINILSFLGIIALIGIVVNDGLVLIGKYNNYLKEGETVEDALLHAGVSRFRAIFLTTITTVAGLLPLILFEKSRQAQFLKPMAIAISYGILMATMLTLVMLPMLLSTGNNLKVYVTWLIKGKKPSREEVERAIIEQKVDS